jgi:glucosamine kinase
VSHAHQAQDGRVPAGALARAVWAVTGTTREAMLAWGESAGQADYAAFAPLLFELEGRDAAAAALLAAAVQSLEAMARALDPDGVLPLVVTGSLGQRLQGRFGAALQARLVGAAGDSADGALWLARRALEAAA